MKKFYNWIVSHPRLVITVFVIVSLVCAVCKGFVRVDYDMNDYLPEDSASTVALDLMEQEFGGGVPNARVMVENVTIPEALEYKARIEAVQGVTEVTWLDDAATASTIKEISRISTIAIIFVILVLILTTESWVEPVVVMIGLGVASGLTTVIGFLALCLMRFRIGPDLGRALAKGIAISLITVFTFMPCLILATYKWLDKLQHIPFVPSFGGFGRFVQKIMLPMLVLFVAVIVPSYLASNANSFYYGASKIFDETTKTGADTARIEEIFGKSDTYVLMVPKQDKATQKQLSDDLHRIPQVSSILSYVDTVGMEIPESNLDQATYAKLCSDRYTRMVISVDAEYEGSDTFRLVEVIRDTAEVYYPGEWYLAGEGISTYDLMDTITKDMTKVNLVAIGAVFLVLLLTLRSVMLPVLLVLSIETAVWINLAIPYFTDATVFYISYLIISSVQLGATVDYAILLTERYKEYRQTRGKKDAITDTLAAVTVSILTSGSVLTVVGFLLRAISSHGVLSQLGYFLGKGTLCSLAIVLFVLPGMLYLFDGAFIKKVVTYKTHAFASDVAQNAQTTAGTLLLCFARSGT